MTDQERYGRTLGLNGGIDKRFFFWMANASLNGSHSWNRFYVMMNNEATPVTNRSANVMAKLTVSPITLMSVEMSSAVMFNWQDRKMISTEKTAFRNYSHKLSSYFFPGKWQIGWKMEYAHSNDERQSKNLFGDASVLYRSKSLDVGVYLNNVFGTYEQRRRTITDLAEYYTVTYMRPRELMLKVSFNL